MATNIRTPFITEKMEKIDKLEESSGSKSKLTTFAERLGLKDTFSILSKENVSGRNVGQDESVITVSHDQLEDLLTSLENTRDMIRQMYMTSTEVKRRRR